MPALRDIKEGVKMEWFYSLGGPGCRGEWVSVEIVGKTKAKVRIKTPYGRVTLVNPENLREVKS